MPVTRSVPLALTVLLLVAGCSSTSSLDPRTWFSRDKAPAPATRENPGVDARLVPLGSSVRGVVRVRESGDLLVVRVEIFNAKPSAGYRVVFHATGNCTSPNGFSAGAPWSPPGAKESPARLLPEIYVNSEGDSVLTARLRGVRLGDLEKRSVLVYEGSSTEPPKPGVPNNVAACGVFERATALFAS